MEFIVYLFCACLLFVAIGDPLFVRALRKRAPDAFLAAGSPTGGTLALVTPYFFSAYHSFIVKRRFASHLSPGSGLLIMANALFAAHILVIALVVLMALSLLASLLASPLGGVAS